MKSAVGTILLGLAAALTVSEAAQAADLPSRAPPVPVISAAPFFLFQDTQISYRFEPTAREPGLVGNNFKNIAALTHVDAWAYGTNFGNVDFLSSNSAVDPATDAAGKQSQHRRRSRNLRALSRNLERQRADAFEDVQLRLHQRRVDRIRRRHQHEGCRPSAAQARPCLLGPQVSFDVPGFLTIEANLYKEWNRNSFGVFGLPTSTNTYADFRVIPEFEVTFLQPLTFTHLPLSYSGFLNVLLPKGSGGIAPYAANDTRTEVLFSNRLTLDLGKVVAQKEHVVDLFVGYKYWYNKFGVNHKVLPGAVESTIFAGVALHMF